MVIKSVTYHWLYSFALLIAPGHKPYMGLLSGALSYTATLTFAFTFTLGFLFLVGGSNL